MIPGKHYSFSIKVQTYQLDRNMLTTTSVGLIKKNKSSAKVQEKQGYEKSIA